MSGQGKAKQRGAKCANNQALPAFCPISHHKLVLVSGAKCPNGAKNQVPCSSIRFYMVQGIGRISILHRKLVLQSHLVE